MRSVKRAAFRSAQRMRPGHSYLRRSETRKASESPAEQDQPADSEQDLRWEQQVDALLEAAFND